MLLLNVNGTSVASWRREDEANWRVWVGRRVRPGAAHLDAVRRLEGESRRAEHVSESERGASRLDCARASGRVSINRTKKTSPSG